MGRAQDSTLPFKCLNIGLDIEQKRTKANKRTRYIKKKVRYIEVFIHNFVDRTIHIW